MKSWEIKCGRMNITGQSIRMGVIFIVLGIVVAVGYTVYSKFWVCLS